jgi:hypothetical protein
MKKVKDISQFGDTGTGNEVEVFNTVIDIIKTLIADLGNGIQRLNFSAATARRKSLYARMAHRLLPNWQLDQYGDHFTLTRPQHKRQQQPQPQEAPVAEDWNAVNRHDHTDGLSKGAVHAYRREHPGSKLQTAVTTKPSKLKAGSKAAKRRRSFCARMTGNKGPMKDEHGRPTPKAKALRRWNCNEDFSPDSGSGGTPYAEKIPVPVELRGLADLWNKFGEENPNIKLALSLTPVIGTGINTIDLSAAVSEGDVGSAVIAALGLIPGFKALSKLEQFRLTSQQLARLDAYIRAHKLGKFINQSGSVYDWASNILSK